MPSQCAEKALKADIAATAKTAPPKLHSLTELRLRASVALPPDIDDALQDLDAYYIPCRYPESLPGMKPEGMPSRQDAEAAIVTAAAILEAVEESAHLN